MWVSGKTKNIAFQLVLILQQCCKTNDFVLRLTVALMEREKREGSRGGGMSALSASGLSVELH